MNKEQKYQLVEKYQIDIKRLERNYIEEPLKKGKRKVLEEPSKQDLYYLNIELNLSSTVIGEMLDLSADSVQKLCIKHNIQKTKELCVEARKRTCLEHFGVECSLQNAGVREKAKQTCIERFGVEYPLQNKEILEKEKQTNLAKYGCEYPAQSEEVKEKMRQTFLDKYGVEHVLQNPEVKEKMKQTNRDRYGVEYAMQNSAIREKSRETCLEHFGVNYPGQSKIIQEKIKQINIEKYGVEYNLQAQPCLEKIRKTFREKYGVDWSSQAKEVRDKIKQTSLEHFGVDNPNKAECIKEKIKQTCIDKFGVDNFAKSEKFAEMFKDEKRLQLMQQKAYETKKKNKSLNISREEEEIYKKLLKKFPDIIRQYKDSRYPFACDFYIPSLDLFIEFNGSWTHGFHPFDENNLDDVGTKELWLQKSEEVNFKGKKKYYYQNAVYTWTELDVKKRKTAKDNNLNWLEFFSKKDLLNYFGL